MKESRVNVNGTDYEITLEEVTAGAEASKPAAPLLGGTGSAVAPAPAAASAGSEQIVSPIPGNILNVDTKVGDAVKKGQSFADFGSHEDGK